MIQIGNDGGLLPQAATHQPTPVGLEVRMPTDQEASMGEYPSVIALGTKALYLAPGERADVIVDFSEVPAGSKLILYNDAPAPAPNGDSRVDYYTGDVDQTAIGGAPTTLAGYGPNTRTVMQFQVDGPAAAPFDLERLQRVLPAAYAAAQDPVLVPTAAYREAYGDALTLPDDAQDDAEQPSASPQAEQSPAQDESRQDDGMGEMGGEVQEDAQQEAGHRSRRAAGGIRHPHVHAPGSRLPAHAPRAGQDGERPLRPAVRPARRPRSASTRRSRPTACSTAVPYSAIDPATEYLALEQEATAPQLGDATQIWRVTHDGTMSHSVTFGGFDVQVLARARREGETRAPDPGELGWKDTLRVDPLESVLIAVRPVLPDVPFKLPASARALDITLPLGAEGAVHAARPAHRGAAGARGRQRGGRPQLRGALGHPPHRRRGEPHRPADRAPGDDRGAGRADGDGRRGGGRRARLDAAAVPAARHRLRRRACRGRGASRRASRPSPPTPAPPPTPTRPRRAGAPTSTASAPRPPPAGRRGRRRPRSACPDATAGQACAARRAATMTDEAARRSA